jgi:hypothetical protein
MVWFSVIKSLHRQQSGGTENVCRLSNIALKSHNDLKLDKDNEIKFCQEYKYLGVIFDASGTDDKEIRSRVI